MDQWTHQNHQSHQNHQNHQNQTTSSAPPSHAHMGHVAVQVCSYEILCIPFASFQPKEEVQYMMRQVTDSVRFAMCEAISHRTPLWDSSREKCSSATRKRLFGEVVDVINSQFVLSPPLSSRVLWNKCCFNSFIFSWRSWKTLEKPEGYICQDTSEDNVWSGWLSYPSQVEIFRLSNVSRCC